MELINVSTELFMVKEECVKDIKYKIDNATDNFSTRFKIYNQWIMVDGNAFIRFRNVYHDR